MRTLLLTIRLSPQERATLAALALAQGLTTADYVRTLLGLPLRRPGPSSTD